MKSYYHITGTSSGLGKAIAEAALKNASNVVYGYARNCTIKQENYFHHTVDLSNLAETTSIQFDEHQDARKIILINNAGTGGEIKYLGEIEDQNIIQGYNLNIISPHLLVNRFISSFKLNHCEKIIINITSGAASSPYDGWSIYCSTKAALDMLSTVADQEQQFRNEGFKIFAIAPGVLNTPMQDKLRATDLHDFSRVGKFLDLKNKNQLSDPGHVAEKIIAIIENPAQLSGVIHRIRL